MPFVAQNLILGEWSVIDTADPPGTITGMTAPTDVAFTLERQSGSTLVAASESISFTERGATGYYFFSFTPQNSGLYVLTLQELNVNSTRRRANFAYEVLPAGAVFQPSAGQCFCAETDVERYAGLEFTTVSQVASAQVLGFMEERSAVLMSYCAFWGLSVTPATVTIGSRLEDILRSAAAIGAALDAVIAWYAQVEPSENEKARQLMARWINLIGDGAKVIGSLQVEIAGTQSSLATNHILSGDTTVRTNEGSPQDIGLQFRMGDLF